MKGSDIQRKEVKFPNTESRQMERKRRKSVCENEHAAEERKTNDNEVEEKRKQ